MKDFTRRDFLHLGVQASAASCSLSLPLAAARESAMLYGVQLFTLRKEAAVDLFGTLKRIAEVGLTEVELFSLAYRQPAATLRQMVADAGLHPVLAGHFSPAQVMARLDYARELGLKWIVTMLPQPKPVSLADYRAFAAELNRMGTAVRDHGMELAFLGHNYELLPQEGTTGFAEMMALTDPALVRLEVDLYWIAQAGLDPAAFLLQNRDRVRLLHMKDRLANVPTSFDTTAASDHSTDLGKGTLALPSLLSQSRGQGIRYAYLDQDSTTIPVFESLRASVKYLRAMKQ